MDFDPNGLAKLWRRRMRWVSASCALLPAIGYFSIGWFPPSFWPSESDNIGVFIVWPISLFITGPILSLSILAGIMVFMGVTQRLRVADYGPFFVRATPLYLKVCGPLALASLFVSPFGWDFPFWMWKRYFMR